VWAFGCGLSGLNVKLNGIANSNEMLILERNKIGMFGYKRIYLCQYFELSEQAKACRGRKFAPQ
jgi:hypothetical protein